MTATLWDRLAALEREVEDLRALARAQPTRPPSMAGLQRRNERVKLTEDPGTDCNHPDGAKAVLLDQADEETQKVVRVHFACGYQKDAKLTVWWRQLPHEKNGKWVPVVPGVALPYVLTSCDSSEPVRHVWADELKDAVDKVAKIDGSATCWQVSRLPEQTCEDPQARAAAMAQAQAATVQGIYEDCGACQACWELTPCDTGDTFLANNDLAAWEGKSVKIGSTCYEVSRADTCVDAELQTIVEYYEDCTACDSCYTLTACWDDEDTITLDNNLLQVALDALAARAANCQTTDADDDGDPDPLPEDGNDLVGKVFEIGGICYQVDSYGTDCGSATHSAAEIAYHDDCASCGCFKLTECEPEDPEDPAEVVAHSGTLGGVTLRELLNGDPEADPPLDPQPFVRLDDGIVYQITAHNDCDEAEAVTILEAYPTCEAGVCWQLENCADESEEITYVDLQSLAEAEGYESPTGLVIKTAEGDCYLVLGPFVWDPAAIEVDVVSFHEECGDCDGSNRYKLTNDCIHEDCEDGDPAPVIVTQTDLHKFLGKLVKYQGVCYTVSQTMDAVTKADLGDEAEGFDDCEACKAADSTWSQTVLEDFRADSGSMKLQMKKATFQITGKSNCKSDWEDVNTGTECSE